MREWLEENLIYIILGILGAALLGGLIWFISGYEPLTEGEVIYKDFYPAHDVYYPIHITVDGMSQTINNYRYVGDRWRLTIQNGEHTDMWYVSESFYNSVKVGDWVTK